MTEKIEIIFEECLSRIENGESIESCILSYPEHSEELEVLLRTFINIRWRTSLVEPSPEFKARGRAHLYNLLNARDKKVNVARVKSRGIFNLQRAWVPALAGMLIFIMLGSVGTAAASTSAMPDQPLYTVKLATEQLRLAISTSDVDKAVLNMEMAEKRAYELEVMVNTGKSDYVIATAERMATSLGNAEQAFNKALIGSDGQPEAAMMTAPAAEPLPGDRAAETKPMQSYDTSDASTDSSVGDPKGLSDNNQRVQAENIPVPAFKNESERIKYENSKQRFQNSVNNNVTVLESVLNKVPENARPSVQNALDLARTNQVRIQSENLNKMPDDTRNDMRNFTESKPIDDYADNKPNDDMDSKTNPIDQINNETKNSIGDLKDKTESPVENVDNSQNNSSRLDLLKPTRPDINIK